MGLIKMLFLRHAYTVMFGWVLVEQAGVPIPSVPLMLAAGTMSAAHKVHLELIIPVVLLACFLWQTRCGGGWAVGLAAAFWTCCANCRLMRRRACTVRRGRSPVAADTLLFAKFVPGVSTIAAPIAGQAGMAFFDFVVYDMIGSLSGRRRWLFYRAVLRRHR